MPTRPPIGGLPPHGVPLTFWRHGGQVTAQGRDPDNKRAMASSPLVTNPFFADDMQLPSPAMPDTKGPFPLLLRFAFHHFLLGPVERPSDFLR